MCLGFVKALVALIPVAILVSGAMHLFVKRKDTASFLQLFGAACLLIVVFAHAFEALNVLPFMGWGEAHSVGHYLDLTSAILGLTLLPLGFFLGIAKNHNR
jgi:hypothetical protein